MPENKTVLLIPIGLDWLQKDYAYDRIGDKVN